MVLKKDNEIPSSEITDEKHYLNRRTFLRGGLLAGTVAGTGLLYRAFSPRPAAAELAGPVSTAPRTIDVAGETPTPYDRITTYNNYYEFSTAKDGVADAAKGFAVRPWTVAVEGLCAKPKVFDIDELARIAPPEERVYRHRCVEAWSMVIPWLGFPLAALLKAVEPLSTAKYVAFETIYAPDRMKNQRTSILEWPYVEGLRIDEAMHPLTILATGLYGRELPPQNGAPLRLVVPWKYGFKGIKAIVKIRLTDAQPPTTWNLAGPDEYGFYSNVNPNVDHPRWSQKSERRIGDFGLRPTLMFNGYGDQVASLYSGMDLRANF